MRARASLRLAAALVAALGALAARPARADSVNCPSGTVSLGESKVDLLGKCGEPGLREERLEERSTFVLDPTQKVSEERKVRVAVERWTYDFGPRRFLQFVTIVSGKVVSVQTGEYGSDGGRATLEPARVAIARCEAQRSFTLGDSTSEVLFRCGEPASRELKQVERRLAAADPSGLVYGEGATAIIETWTYNFGPRAFLRRLKFVDGRLVKIVTGGYGYAQ